MKSVKIPFGLRGERLAHVSEVPRGDRCDCVCPACREPLRANKGQSGRRHYFSHKPDSACSAGYESALHLAAKQVLQAAREVVLPGLTIISTKQDIGGAPHTREETLIEPNDAWSIDSVKEEVTFRDIRADIVMVLRGRQVIVEVAVTNPVTEEKRRKIQTLGVSAIEIDLSNLPRDVDWDLVRERVLSGCSATWIHNPVAERRQAALDAEVANLVALANEKILMERKRQEDSARRKKQREESRIASAELKFAQHLKRRNTPEYDSERMAWTERSSLWEKVRKWYGISRLDQVPDFLNHPCDAEWIFPCDRRLWQAATFQRFIRNRLSDNRRASWAFSGRSVAAWLDKQGTKTHAFIRTLGWAQAKGHVISTEAKHFVDQWALLDEYLEHLSTLGFLIKDPWMRSYHVHFDQARVPTREDIARMARRSAFNARHDSYVQSLNERIAAGDAVEYWHCEPCGARYPALVGATPNVAKCTLCGARQGKREIDA